MRVVIGEKVLVQWFRGYLISVVYGGRGGGARSGSRGGAKPAGKDVMTLFIYDIQNQFVGERDILSSLLSSILTSLPSLPDDTAFSYC